MTDAESDIDRPYYCPWCEAVIVVDGEIATSEADAYWHAYDHRDKGPYAVAVTEAFEPLDVTLAESPVGAMENEEGDDE